MRIVLFYEKRHIGGAQTYVDECVAQLRRLGAAVDIIEGDQINRSVVQSIITGKYDCAFLHFLSPQYLKIVLYMFFARIPIVTVLHGIWVKEEQSQQKPISTFSLFYNWFFQYLLCIFSNQLVVLSSYAASLTYKTFPFMRHKVRIIPGGVNLRIYYPVSKATKMKLRKKLFLPESSTIVLIASRVERRKGIIDAVLAFSIFLKKNPDSMLCLVVPFGPYNSYELLSDIMNVIEKNKLRDHVRFIPSGSRKENAKYYQLSDVLLVSSKKLEMFGLVILEALASGCIPITYANNGMEHELRHLHPSLVVAQQSPILLSQSLSRITSLPSKQLVDLQKKGRELALQYAWIRISRRLYSVFTDVI